MFKNKQIENKYDIINKRTFDAGLAIVPTSILVNQTLARLKFACEKKIKFSYQLKNAYKFK